jgi:hypothetical protein
MSDFSGIIPLFFESFLSKPASALPKGAQWVVDFEGLGDVKAAILKTAQLEPNAWDIESGLNVIVDNADYNKKGCLFAQAVNLPGESTIVNPEGIQKNHYIQTTTGDGRSPYASNTLNISFLETNISFVDNVIRPWIITTGRLGLIARPPGETNYRQDISIYKLGVLTSKEAPFVLMKYTFFGACPIEVGAEEFNYSPTTGPINRDVTFLYHNYKIEVPKSVAITRNNEIFKPELAGRRRT